MIVEKFVIKKGNSIERDTSGERAIEMRIDKSSFFSVIDMESAMLLDLVVDEVAGELKQKIPETIFVRTKIKGVF